MLFPRPYFYYSYSTCVSLRAAALHRCHDDPSGGHLGYEKTLHKLQQEAYWAYMSQDVEQHCRQCTKCNASKPPAPQRAPMTSVLIGKPWQMVAEDILEVSVSSTTEMVFHKSIQME